MTEKQCFKCQQVKPLDDFYKHPQMADGRLNKCKACAKSDASQHRSDNLEACRAYDRKRFQHDLERRSLQIDQSREWARNNPEKMAEVKAQWQARNPEKRQCHISLASALTKGTLVKSASCQSCGISGVRIHGHHHDYTKPLDVMWLCATCHAKQHRLERERLRQKEPRNERAA